MDCRLQQPRPHRLAGTLGQSAGTQEVCCARQKNRYGLYASFIGISLLRRLRLQNEVEQRRKQ